ncbi:hypothetical protein [Fusobacterium varium]|jgi:hypothetical protein
MEIVDITRPSHSDGRIIVEVKYNSGKHGCIQIKNGEIIDFPFGDKVKKAIVSLLKKDSYAWLKLKYYEISKKRKINDDIDFLFETFTDDMEVLKDIQKEIKKVYL